MLSCKFNLNLMRVGEIGCACNELIIGLMAKSYSIHTELQYHEFVNKVCLDR